MQHFATQDAMLAVAGFEILILAERSNLNMLGQAFAQETAIVAKSAVEDCYLEPLTAMALPMPALDIEARQMQLALECRCCEPIGGKMLLGCLLDGGARLRRRRTRWHKKEQ
jgi:hypothetical protein